ncbi:MAG: hypothetical protein WEE89_10570 [Gemmatimonadota bacterium]
MRNLARTCVLLIASLTAACASASTGASSDRNRITAEQLSRSTAPNAYDVIRTLQPQWLENRGASGLNEAPSAVSAATVYVDGSRAGDLDVLRNTPLHTIAEIRFWTAREAAERFGAGFPRGVIEITSKRIP